MLVNIHLGVTTKYHLLPLQLLAIVIATIIAKAVAMVVVSKLSFCLNPWY